jgi:hypothetical protein
MSGQRRLFREGNRKPSLLASEMRFGLIAMGLLAAFAIIVSQIYLAGS